MIDEDGAQPIVDGEGMQYAQQVARAFALGEPARRTVSSLNHVTQKLAEQIGLALLSMDPPRRLSLRRRLRIAEEALREGGWIEAAEENLAPAPQTLRVYTLCSSTLPGYYALDNATGRPLVGGDRIALDVGNGCFVNAVIRRDAATKTHQVCFEDGGQRPPESVRAGMRLRLRNGAQETGSSFSS